MNMENVGKRVELHPALDLWMMGDRFGTVVKAGRTYYSVKMDKSGRTVRLLPESISAV